MKVIYCFLFCTLFVAYTHAQFYDTNETLPSKKFEQLKEIFESLDNLEMYLKEKAEQGDMHAQGHLGILYSEEAEKHDMDESAMEESARWFRRAMRTGIASIKNDVKLDRKQKGNADVYEVMHEKTWSYPEVLELLKKLEKQGDANVHRVMHKKNWDNKESTYLLKKAIEGNAEAQYVFGSVYLLGIGVKRNNKESMYWLEKAAKQGHSAALKRLENSKSCEKLLTGLGKTEKLL